VSADDQRSSGGAPHGAGAAGADAAGGGPAGLDAAGFNAAGGGPAGFNAAGVDGAGARYRGLAGLGTLGGMQRRNSLTLIRIVVAVLTLILLFGSLTHIAPAVRAGLHEGTRGSWVVTGRTCSRKACEWTGKFVLPNGHVQVASVQYDGAIPAGIHAGTKIPALYPGGGLAFPITGSDLWISLLVAIVVALLGLYWATHKWVAGYFRHRADTSGLGGPLP
jgi:hypothetical protein